MIRRHLWQRLRLWQGTPCWKRGYWYIGLGLFLVLAGQFWTALPVVTAIAMIGRGAVLTLQAGSSSSRQDSLVVLNLTIYGTFICLAIVAQSNGILQASMARVSLGMLLDHATAIVLLAGLICRVFYQLSQPG